jgi:hypothetical protein
LSAKEVRILLKFCDVNLLVIESKPNKPTIESAAFRKSESSKAELLGKNVKLIMVVDGQGETDCASYEEIRLRSHIGEVGSVVEIGEDAFQILFENGEKLWAVAEEISLDAEKQVNPPIYDFAPSDMIDRLIDRHDGDFNKALHEVQLALLDSRRSGDRVILQVVYDGIASRKRTLGFHGIREYTNYQP